MNKHRLYNLIVLGLLSVLSVLSVSVDERAVAEEQREIKIYTAAVYHLVRFVRWKPIDSPRPLIVCVAGTNEEFDSLKSHFKNQIIGGRVPHVVKYKSEDEECNVLYMTTWKKGSSELDLNSLGKKGTLTVGHTESFLDAGGVIALIEEDNRLRIVVSKVGLASSPLSLSSELLAIAKLQ